MKELLQSQNIYLTDETINDMSCSVGYVKEFKLRWFATQLNTFIIIGKTDAVIDKHQIEQFSSACFNYALKCNKGWPRGLQSAVASIAILQGNKIENDAVEFCETLSKKHWSAFEIPVIYDLNQKSAIRFKTNPIFGAIYYPYFAETIDKLTGN